MTVRALPGPITHPAWVIDAACRGVGEPDAWFPSRGVPTRENLLAREICGTCPVRAECAEYGAGEIYGVWGGQTPSQRMTARAETQPETRTA